MVFIKYCVFFQELSIFCDLSFASTGLLLAVQKWSTNKRDCTLGSLARMSCSSTCRRWVVVNWEKTQFFMNTLYIGWFANSVI